MLLPKHNVKLHYNIAAMLMQYTRHPGENIYVEIHIEFHVDFHVQTYVKFTREFVKPRVYPNGHLKPSTQYSTWKYLRKFPCRNHLQIYGLILTNII